MNPTHELLSKADVIREYKYPRRQLDADLEAGKIAHMRENEYSRVYVPRYAVERRIEELTARKESA